MSDYRPTFWELLGCVAAGFLLGALVGAMIGAFL